MTILGAYWGHEGKDGERECRAIVSAQTGKPAATRFAKCGPLNLGSAGSRSAGPVHTRTGAFSLLGDVRLDNRADFFAGLRLSPKDAAGLTDVALMLLCIERWGPQIFESFVGDLAMILWDRNAAQLSLIRDYTGQRPLHYFESRHFLAVASMAKGLHALDAVPLGVDTKRMLEILAGEPHQGRKTCFAQIHRVEPGEIVTFSGSSRSRRLFWSLPGREIVLPSHRDYADALAERLDEAVAARLPVTDSLVATHLSSGLDSSAVTTSAARQFAGKVVAFTSVPPVPAAVPRGRFGDEGGLAASTAASYQNVQHRLIRGSQRLALERLEPEHAQFERPDLNMPNHDWAEAINSAAAQERIKVLLSGTMGNATISYRAPSIKSAAARRILPPSMYRVIRRFRERDYDLLLNGVINLSAPGLAEMLADRPARPPGGSVAERLWMLRRVDFGTFNKGTLLRWNIQALDPTTDRRVVEFCLQVPLAQYSYGRTPRALIRTALRQRVPECVLDERRRGLQSPHWFAMLSNSRDQARHMLDEITLSAEARELLDLGKMRRMLDDWPDTSVRIAPPNYRYGFLRGLSVGWFIRTYSSNRTKGEMAGC